MEAPGPNILRSSSHVIHPLCYRSDKSLSISFLDPRAGSWASGSEWVSWWDVRDPREQKAGDTQGTCRARAQCVTTEVPTVVESFFTVLTAERLLLGVGPLVSVQRGVVREPLGVEITAVGLLALWVSW